MTARSEFERTPKYYTRRMTSHLRVFIRRFLPTPPGFVAFLTKVRATLIGSSVFME